MLLRMLKQIVPKGMYGSKLVPRTARENKDDLQNILSQRVIVTKYYANI